MPGGARSFPRRRASWREAREGERACRERLVERRLEAMAQSKVENEPFARGARFAENGVELSLGIERVWATPASARGCRSIVAELGGPSP